MNIRWDAPEEMVWCSFERAEPWAQAVDSKDAQRINVSRNAVSFFVIFIEITSFSCLCHSIEVCSDTAVRKIYTVVENLYFVINHPL